MNKKSFNYRCKLLLCFLVVIVLFTKCKKGTNTTYYENGNIKSEIEIVDGVADGVAKEYYESGKLMSITTFSAGLRDGDKIFYYENGNIKYELKYKEGKEDGRYKKYFENSKIESDASFKEGKQNGKTFQYYASGQIQAELNYINGARNGELLFYFPNGKLSMRALAENDDIIYYEEFSENGRIENKYRKIVIKQEVGVLKAGERYRADVYLLGPFRNNEVIKKVIGILAGKGSDNKNINLKFENGKVSYESLALPAGNYHFNINFAEEDSFGFYTYHADTVITIEN